jgi:hypothetical protein
VEATNGPAVQSNGHPLTTVEFGFLTNFSPALGAERNAKTQSDQCPVNLSSRRPSDSHLAPSAGMPRRRARS